MGNSHVAHDCKVEKLCLWQMELFLGSMWCHEVFIGGGLLYQFVQVGDGAMLGGLAEISADVPPQITVTGRNLPVD